MVASDVTSHAAKAFLNDAAQALWTDAILLPYLAQAALELESHFRVNEIPVQVRVGVTLEAEAADTEFDEYPVDFIEPISIKERLNDTTIWSEDIEEVDDVDPNATLFDGIVMWCFRNNKIYFNPPLTAREVRLLYIGSITAIASTGSTIDLTTSKSFLAARTAQLAAKNGGNNPTKADALQPDVDEARDLLVRGLVKNNQTAGAGRRKAYKGHR